MDLVAFEHDRSFIWGRLSAAAKSITWNMGGEALEGDFFRPLINRQVLQRLADSYPTPRQKGEVPVWLYRASEISLKPTELKVITPSRASYAREV